MQIISGRQIVNFDLTLDKKSHDPFADILHKLPALFSASTSWLQFMHHIKKLTGWIDTDRQVSKVPCKTGSCHMELIHNGLSIFIRWSVLRLTNWDECKLTVNPRLQIGANIERLLWAYAFLWCHFATYAFLSSYVRGCDAIFAYFAIFRSHKS